jgi:hypothetical protein
MLHRVFFGEYSTPYPGVFPMAVPPLVKEGRRPTLDPQMPEAFVKIVTSCWDASPEKRPDCEQLKEALQSLENGKNVCVCFEGLLTCYSVLLISLKIFPIGRPKSSLKRKQHKNQVKAPELRSSNRWGDRS